MSVIALFYPLGYLAGLFVVLLAIAVFLSIFVFPSIVAIRRHGWFDNVVDTIEAVGTKPQVLIGSLLLTVLMATVASTVATGGMGVLKHLAPSLPGENNPIVATEQRADSIAQTLPDSYQRHLTANVVTMVSRLLGSSFPVSEPFRRPGLNFDYQAGFGSNSSSVGLNDNFIYYGPGLVTGIWQCLILVLIYGYVCNLLLSGGMLTYLLVREDDYWDDEDLEDLDQLAKELEDEAKADAAKAQAATAAPAPAVPATPPAAEAKPAAPASPPPAG